MRFFFRLLLLITLIGLVSCQRADLLKLDVKGSDLTGVDIGGDFALTDQHGATRGLQDFNGKVVALFFGYTHCPDICPTTLLEYSAVTKELGNQADKLQVVFITVDPERDTRQVLAQYVPYFGSRFIGLTGGNDAIASVMKSYKVVAQRVPLEGGNYSVDHSAGSYLLDRDGKVRVYEPYGTPVASLTHDIRQLLR